MFNLNLDSNTSIIINIAIILFAGFLATRLTKKIKLPNVTGYIFAGIFIGPYIFNVINLDAVKNMDFVTDIALAFIAFGVGKYFKFSNMKKTGFKVITITLFESLMAALFIALAMIYVFKLPVSFAIMLGAIGSATAPASTIMTIRQYHAKGEFVDIILQVIALDDAVAIIAFSICAAVAQTLNANTAVDTYVFIMPILTNLGAVIVGIIFGFTLNKLINYKRSQDNRLVIAIAVILAMTGFCSAFNVSPLLSCMALGATYVNISQNKELFKQINNFTPPIMTMFFVMAGMKLNVLSLTECGAIGAGYFIVRIVGKYVGALIGCKVSGSSKAICKYLGLALIPQAGVSIGLAALGERILPTEMGALLSTIILSSAVLYEIVGPVASKIALCLSNSITEVNEIPNDTQKSPQNIMTHVESN